MMPRWECRVQRVGKPGDIAGIVTFVDPDDALDHGSYYSGRWRFEALTSCLRIAGDLFTAVRRWDVSSHGDIRESSFGNILRPA